jgi:hypothetical protein
MRKAIIATIAVLSFSAAAAFTALARNDVHGQPHGFQ